jgi:hypothetical protein
VQEIDSPMIWFRDANGTRFFVHELSVPKRRLFRRYYHYLISLMGESQRPIDELLDDSAQFQDAIAACLEIYDLQHADVGLSQIGRLLTGYVVPGEYDKNGKQIVRQGLLAELAFSATQPRNADSEDGSDLEPGDEVPTDLDPDDHIVATLWVAQGGNLKDVLDSANCIPASQLVGILRARGHVLKSLDPKAQKKAKEAKKQASELAMAKEMQSQIKSGLEEYKRRRERGENVELDVNSMLDGNWLPVDDLPDGMLKPLDTNAAD